MTPRQSPTSPPHSAAARSVPARQAEAPAQISRPIAGGSVKGRTPGAGSTSPRDAAGSRPLPALNAPIGGRRHVVCTTRHWRPGAPSAPPPSHADTPVENSRRELPVVRAPIAPPPPPSPPPPPLDPAVAVPRASATIPRPAPEPPPAPALRTAPVPQDRPEPGLEHEPELLGRRSLSPAPTRPASAPPRSAPPPTRRSTPGTTPRAALGPLVAAAVFARSEIAGRWVHLVHAFAVHTDRVVEALDRARVERLQRRLQRDRARHARPIAPADLAPQPFTDADVDPDPAPQGAESPRFLGVFARTAPPAWRLMLIGALGCLLVAAAVIIARNELAKSRIAPTPRVFNPRRADLLRQITLDRAELIRRTILAFHATHGRLPRDLSELVPEFLPGVPKPVNGALDWSYRVLPAPARADGAEPGPAFDLSFRSWRDPMLKHEQVDQEGRWTLAE